MWSKLRVLVAAAACVAVVSPSQASGTGRTAPTCREPEATTAYTRRVERALGARRDVWGQKLLAQAVGPTYASARRYLAPLLYAVGPGGRRVTASGVYYLPFTFPHSVGGPRGFGLHVADGSEILVRRVGGPSLTIFVGAGDGERYGSCLARLQTPRLAQGYLPILETSYVDRYGVLYTEESFAGRLPNRRSLVSFVHVRADARLSLTGSAVRFAPSRGATIRALVPAGRAVDLYAAWVHAGPHLARIGRSTYVTARTRVSAYWRDRIAAATQIEVPEQRVMDAERALLVQELEMTWRYSVGNSYEELSFAEALDVARMMAGYGYGDVTQQILRFTLRRLPVRFTNWRAGERLLAGAVYFQLERDRPYVSEETPALRSVVDALAREIDAGGTGLLGREPYSTDIGTQIYSLHGQTLVWEGLLAMGRAWADTGRPELAERCRQLALRLEAGLRLAVRGSEQRLPDGSLFVPAALLDEGAPFARLTDSRAGTYWNLVAPYALASGFFAPGSAETQGVLRYMLGHGSRLLGLVRAGAYRLAPSEANGASGIDEVYGVNVARFLADNGEADQLVLSLYGTLAAALTPGTYVSGEAASVAPIVRRFYRTMYLPPNNAGAASFLETLRLMLVHETRGPEGLPRGLELAFATPRAWLERGKRIAVEGAPTSFGPVTFSIERQGNVIHVTVVPPAAPSPAALHVRLRLPGGERIAAVTIAGVPVFYDPETGTIDLTGRTGELELDARVARA